ncbi:MAG: Rv3235 family protein [Actinobacteria bacterium]|nr:Rv3235 family protein [Actinomycetota bacterium]
MTVLATCRPAPDSRPPARRLLEPLRIRTTQPTLPLDAPAVLAEPVDLDPTLRRLATAAVSGVVEMLAGRRPAEQLESWMEPEPLALLSHLRGAGATAGIRLQSVRIQQPRPGALEVTAHLRQGSASRAAALRFSRRGERWTVTRIELALHADVIHRAGRLR